MKHCYALSVTLLVIWLGSAALVRAQAPVAGSADIPEQVASTPVASALSATLPSVPGPIPLETVTTRKAALLSRLEALAQSSLPKEEIDVERAALEQQLKVLTALEEALQKRVTYVTQLETLGQRLEELEAEHQQLENQPPQKFADVSESLRDQYEAQRRAAQAELEALNKQAATGEVRLARLAEELQRRTTEWVQLEKGLLDVRGTIPGKEGQGEEHTDVGLQELQVQLLGAEIEALKAEREWLTKRGPLYDALLKVAKLRLQIITQDLETIKTALSRELQQEQETLSATAARLQDRLREATDPTEIMELQIRLETIAIRQATAEPRQQLHDLSNEVQTQERNNAQLRQDLARLTTLVERFSNGELVAPRLLAVFERLRRERGRYDPTPIDALKNRLNILIEAILTVDDRLYEFDRQVETRINTLLMALQAVPAEQRDAEVSRIRRVLDDQRAAWREQQQVLAMLEQELTKLLTLYREYKRVLDESYHLVLTRMFWLRDGERLSLSVGKTILVSIVPMVQRLVTFGRAVPARLFAGASEAPALSILALLILLGLPFVAYVLRRRLRRAARTSLTAAIERQVPPGLGVAVVIVMQTAIWPGYLALNVWMLSQLLVPLATGPHDLAEALFSGLQSIALVWWVALCGRTIFRSNGWGQHFWNLSDDLCRLLRRTVFVGCVTAVLCLVPHRILLIAPGEAEVAAGSLATARCLLLVFQAVILVLTVIIGRRGSLLMSRVLTRSREAHGLLWRIWPLIYGVLVLGMASIMVLDGLGYRYAAQFVWSHTLRSLAVVLILYLLVGVMALRLLQRFVHYLFSVGGRLSQEESTVEEAKTRSFNMVRTIYEILLGCLTVGLVLRIWGLDVLQFLTSPLGMDILQRGGVLIVTIGFTVALIQLSTALTEYLLQPKVTSDGVTHQVGRKLKTLAPLLQTVIKVGTVFAMVLIVLDQIGIATGPILAGVGIFGLAVGFASQSLIKDVINGLFILFEDSIAVGDVANLRGIGGVVEKITLRAVTLRDLSGNVHVIPNSSIDLVTNFTRNFSFYLLDVSISYQDDVDKTIETMRAVAEEMRSDPLYRFDLLDPLEVMGLDRFEDSAMVVRARLRTRPGQQWRLGREFNRRMKKAFDEQGITIPFPHRTLYWGGTTNGLPTALQKTMEESFSVGEDRQP